MQKFKLKRNYSAVEGGMSFLVGVIALILISLVLQLIYSSIGSNSVGGTLLSILIQVGIFLAAVLPARCLGSRPTYALKKISVKVGFVSALISVLAIVGFMGLGSMFNVMLVSVGYGGSGASVGGSNPFSLIVSIIRIVILAPFVEELLFRSSILSSLGLLGKMSDKKRIVFMVIGSGLLFSIYHMNPLQTFYQFFLGCAIGYAVIRFGSIVPAIIIHVLNNGLALVLQATGINARVEALIMYSYQDVGFILIAFAASIALAVGMWLAIKILCDKFGSLKPLSNNINTLDNPQDGSTLEQKEQLLDNVMPQSGTSFVNYADKGGTMAAALMYIVGIAACLAMWAATLVSGFMMA